MEYARLNRYGLLAVTGADARVFLHAQLTNDIEHLASGRAALAGWCSAKGRLLASFLVVPAGDGLLQQLSRGLGPAVQKRLSMFVLRAKVKVDDGGYRLFQFGVWGASALTCVPLQAMKVKDDSEGTWVPLNAERVLVI